MRTAFPLLLTLALAAGAAGQPRPPSACPAVTLFALPDQADALRLTPTQVDTLESLRESHLHVVFETAGDVDALWDALATLERPLDSAEVLALLADLHHHEAELADEIAGGEAALLGALDDRQWAAWAALVRRAALASGDGAACLQD